MLLRYWFKCLYCKEVHYIDYDGHEIDRNSAGEILITRLVRKLPDGTKKYLQDDVKCPKCHKVMDYKKVKAIQSSKKCSAICTGAKGHDCDCSCGGRNHGKDKLIA